MDGNAILYFHRDAYVIDRQDLKGRHSAGNGYLRAHLAGLAGATIYATGPASEERAFRSLITALAPRSKGEWIPAHNLAGLAPVGCLSLPGPGLVEAANLRARVGAAAYSLIGVTHTTASHRIMDAISGLMSAPVMPWDALICTSRAVKATVDQVLQSTRDYLTWRFEKPVMPPLPQRPVIPLGIHTDEFQCSPAEREEARRALGLSGDDVVLLFVGRLSFHAKAHPHAMYLAAEAAAARVPQRVVLLQCGWFANDGVEQGYKAAAATWCPSVQCLWADGREAAARRRAWAAADVFVSLSDNVQETYGLTPVEAMAAGLPCVVTDWDGYRDTVRDGVDGVTIPTFMPAAPFTERLGFLHEARVLDYDHYCGISALTVSIDHRRAAEALESLIKNPALRQRMGEAGRQRARDTYDWRVVFAQYQALWRDLAGVRRERGAKLEGRRAPVPARQDPARLFASYPTHRIDGSTRVELTAIASSFDRLAVDALFPTSLTLVPDSWTYARRLIELAANGPVSLGSLGIESGLPLEQVVQLSALLLKAGVFAVV